MTTLEDISELTFDTFSRRLILELASTLEDVVGMREAEGFVAVVGARVGAHIHGLYQDEVGHGQFELVEVAKLLVDLKARIGGTFRVESFEDDRIVLANSRCPFGAAVMGRRSLCMMTSNVFGHIAAESLGYARVELAETIAAGDGRCLIVIELEPGDAANRTAREYFKVGGGVR